MGETHRATRPFREAILRRPMLPVAALFMLGIAVQGQVMVTPGVGLGIAGGLLIGSVLAWGWAVLAECLLGGCILLGGVVAGQRESCYYPADHIGQFASEEPKLAQVELRISQVPRVLNDSPTARARQVAQGEVVHILTRDGWKAASGRMLVQIDEPHPELAMAQRVVALGLLQRPAAAMNPGQFDWSGYYREQRILASLRVAHVQNVRILASPGAGLLDRLRELVRRALQRGFAERSIDHALLRALVLGDSDPQLREVQEDFVRTGTSHHLAISGMHIAILGGFVFLVCRAAFLPPRLATWIGLGFVILYGLVALPSPPVVRSVLLCTAFGLGLLSRRSLDGVQLLSLSVVLMLIYHPLDLFNAGFQLSFGTVLGLMLFTRPTVEFLNSLRDRDVLIAMSLQKRSAWRRFLLHIRQRLLEAVVVGAVAWVVSAPLIAWHFNQLNPWAPVASLVLAIPVLIALIGGFLKILLTLVFPYLAGVWAALAAAPIAMMRALVDWLACIPGSDALLPRPSIGWIVLFYVLLALPLLPWGKTRFRLVWRCGPGVACLMIPLLPVLPFTHKAIVPGEFRMTLLSVGAGQCLVMHLPSGQVAMVDAGSSSNADLSRQCIKPYLKAFGIGRVDAIFITHANIDHFSAAAEVVREQQIRQVYTTTQFLMHAEENAAAQGMLDELKLAGRSPRVLAAGERLSLDANTTCEILWPPAARDLEPNDSSLVVRVNCQGRSILIPGDIEDLAKKTLLSDPERLRADVLVAPHHGSSTPATEEFLAAVNPQIVLCSNGRTLTQKQRDFDRLAKTRALRRTHNCGAIAITVAATGELRTETFRRPRLEWREERP